MGSSRSRNRRSGPNWAGIGVIAALVAVLAFSGWLVVRPTGTTVSATDDATSAPSPFGQGGNDRERLSVAVLGDSYSAGSAENDGPEWPELLEASTGNYYDTFAVGGTGYVSGSEERPSYQQRALELTEVWDGDVLIVYGSINDSSRDPDAIRTSATATLQQLSADLPDAEIVAVGPTWPVAYPPSGTPEQNRVAVREAAEAAGVGYVDPMADPWFGLSQTSLIGGDEVHPTDAGHELLAENMRLVVRGATRS